MKAILLSIEKENFNLDDDLKMWKKQGFVLLGILNVNETTKLSYEYGLITVGINADINIYPEYRQVFVGDTEIILKKKEFDILYYLAINKNKILTFKQIISKVWGEEYYTGNHRAVWNQISNLRKKLQTFQINEITWNV